MQGIQCWGFVETTGGDWSLGLGNGLEDGFPVLNSDAGQTHGPHLS